MNTKKKKVRKKKQRILITLISIIAFFTIFGQFTSSCIQFRVTSQQVDKSFVELSLKPKLKTYQRNNRTIHYADIGADSLPMVIFFHGAPGSWSAFMAYMKDEDLTNNFRIVAVDRPGYGYSDFGQEEVSLKKQADLFLPLLDLNKSPEKPLLAGHSLGGPVIARMAMDFPKKVGGLFLIAPSIDPKQEKEEWYRVFGRYPPFRWLLPDELRVTNDEIYFLKEELEKMLPLWKNITVPVKILHGKNDQLVPVENAFFGESVMTNTQVENIILDDANHFLPWNRYETIKYLLLNFQSDTGRMKSASASTN